MSTNITIQGCNVFFLISSLFYYFKIIIKEAFLTIALKYDTISRKKVKQQKNIPFKDVLKAKLPTS